MSVQNPREHVDKVQCVQPAITDSTSHRIWWTPAALSGLINKILHSTPNWASFYQRDAMLARVIAIATCPSVRPSRAGIVKTKKASSMISSPSNSSKTLVFWRQISSPNSKGFPRMGASNKGRSEKFSNFLALSVNQSISTNHLHKNDEWLTNKVKNNKTKIKPNE